MSNLQGANPVGRDDGDHSYAAQTVSRRGPNRRRRDCGRILSTEVMTTEARGVRMQGRMSVLARAHKHSGGARRQGVWVTVIFMQSLKTHKHQSKKFIIPNSQ